MCLSKRKNLNKKKQLRALLFEETMKYSLSENGKVVAYKICINCLQKKALWVTISTHHTCLRLRQSYPHNRLCRHTPMCGVCIRCCCKWIHQPGRRKHLQLHKKVPQTFNTLVEKCIQGFTQKLSMTRLQWQIILHNDPDRPGSFHKSLNPFLSFISSQIPHSRI